MRGNLKKVIAFAQTVAMVATLTVGITFASTQQTEAAENVKLNTPIQIAASEYAEYEFSVSNTGYYKICSEIGEYELYGTLFEKIDGQWEEIMDSYDTHTNSNFVIKSALYAGTDYKIVVNEAEYREFNANLYVEKWNPEVSGVTSKTVYCNVGDDVELKPYLLVDDYITVEDFGIEGITYEWFEDQDSENIISTERSYTIKNITAEQMDTDNLFIGCRVYKDGEQIDVVYFSICDIDYEYNIESKTLYLNEGENAKLELNVNDYYGNAVDLNNPEFTFEWYADGSYDCISTASAFNYTAKFGDAASVNVECYVLKNDKYIGYAIFKIVNKKYPYEFNVNSVSSYEGEGAIFVSTIENTLEEEVIEDPAKEGLTMEWYKLKRIKTEEGGYDYSEPVKVGSGFYYTIDNVSKGDMYSDIEDEDSAYFEVRLYKDGKLICQRDTEITNNKNIETNCPSVAQIIRTKPGKTIDLMPNIYVNGNKVSNDGTYKLNWARYTENDYNNIESTDNKKLTVNVTDNDIYTYNNRVSYQCNIEKDGEIIEFVEFVLLLEEDNNTNVPTNPTQPTPAAPATVAPTPTPVAPTPTTVASTEDKVEKTKATITSTKNTVKISLKKVKNAKGYEIQISNTKKFKKKGLIKKTVKGNKAVVKKLKGNKKYFVRVRAYKIVNNKKVYGGWTKVQAVKTKK